MKAMKLCTDMVGEEAELHHDCRQLIIVTRLDALPDCCACCTFGNKPDGPLVLQHHLCHPAKEHGPTAHITASD